ncbi:HNH endonuclease [Escherichia coli]
MAKKPTPDQVKKIRSGITKKIRFEVFKRDGFKCQYCGSSAPDVILHVDHINPVSKGGDNDMMNLITSCDSCNGGKSDKLLSDNSIMEKQRQQLHELNTKREQLEMMIKWRDGLKSLKDDVVDNWTTFKEWVSERIREAQEELPY